MKKHAITFSLGALMGVALILCVFIPDWSGDRARADERERAYNDAIATIADGRRELDAIRDSLDRAESANRELTSRLASATDTTSRSVDTSRAIAIGIDGDLGELAIARDAVQNAIETASRLSLGDGEPDKSP